MYVATENKDLKFKYLHEKCMSPVQYRKYCPNCDREIIPEEIVRGYEYQKGSYVIINEEDLARIPLETTKTIDILDFVQLDQVDPIYFDKTYYLEPSPGGEKAYTLIIEAMKRTNKVAIAKVIIRSKQSLAALRVKDKTLIMETIFYPDEIRSPDSLSSGVDVSKLHDNEIKMAVNLIENLSVNFDPGKYEDEYRKALWELIEGKIVGREVSHVQVSEPTNVVDLMEALKASVELAQQQHKKTSSRKPGSKSTKKASTGT
jgi:DNA end-binding protein Ku